MQQIVKRCPQDGHEHDLHMIECEVCFGPLRWWCRECGVWLDGDNCATCLAREAAVTKPPVPTNTAASSTDSLLPKAAMICGILSLIFSLCTCLGTFVGLAAVGLSFWAYWEIGKGHIDRRHLPQVIIGGVCGALGFVFNCGISFLVFMSAVVGN